MKLIFDRTILLIKVQRLFVIAAFIIMMLSSCHKEYLDIQQNFPFEVNIMPIPKEVASGQKIEIRITIERGGNFTGANYFIRYFQFDGQGRLQYYNDPAYSPNDLYRLPKEQFRLYYTSQSSVSQTFHVWISDQFRNEKELTFEFNSSD